VSEVMTLGDVCVLSLIYIHDAAVRRFCAVHCIIFFYFLLSNYSTYFFSTSFLRLFSCCVCLFSLLCILCFCTALRIDSPFVYSFFFPIFVQVYIPLPPDGNPTAVNKYLISSYNRL
jgi:hypothetical protein